jgi:hypothetical protein
VSQVGSGSDEATLLRHQNETLREEKRRLRLVLRSVLLHIPEHLRAYPTRVLEETK